MKLIKNGFMINLAKSKMNSLKDMSVFAREWTACMLYHLHKTIIVVTLLGVEFYACNMNH